MSRSTRYSRFRLWLLPAVFGGLAVACEPETVDPKGPEHVVEEFVRRMQSVHGDPKAASAAYELIWAEGKSNLVERAKRASAASGRPVAPESMLAPSRFALAFHPAQYQARIEGEWAEVTATGSTPGELSRIRCVREDGGWRVVLALPALPAIQRRDRGEL